MCIQSHLNHRTQKQFLTIFLIYSKVMTSREVDLFHTKMPSGISAIFSLNSTILKRKYATYHNSSFSIYKMHLMPMFLHILM